MYELKEHIGPWQVEGEKLWFGKTFYDGEGNSGIGGFGYFDPSEKRYRLFTSSLIADWSVSAISVQPDAVWLALVSRGEYGDDGGGLLRFDRQSETFQRVTTGQEIGQEFVRVDDRLLLATDIGITVIREDQAKKYIVDQTTDGRLRIVPADK